MKWLTELKRFAERKPIVALRIEDDEWKQLRRSRLGLSEFTLARSHDELHVAKAPILCIVLGTSNRSKHAHVGLVTSRQAITTLQTRIKIRCGSRIDPDTIPRLVRLLSEKRHANALKAALANGARVVQLTPKLSSHLVERLASIESNAAVLRAISMYRSARNQVDGIQDFQEDAVKVALKAFGLSSKDRPVALDVVRGKGSSLARIPAREDVVIAHDARSIPGYELIGSDITGRAVFERNNERLEVYTANRQPLEELLGVDLIYLNTARNNIVMVQYKMLEYRSSETDEDWVYVPDRQLESEIKRMRRFDRDHGAGPYEYRLNPSVFFLKFVKRQGTIGRGGIVIPIDHYQRIAANPEARGPKGGLRISFRSLSGRYMRQAAFLDLVRSGYIGAHAETTEHLKALVEHVLARGKGAVAAIQSEFKGESEYRDESGYGVEDEWDE